jgi:hypothetical protein
MRALLAAALGLLLAGPGLSTDDPGPTPPSTASAPSVPSTPELARAAFERFRGLEGQWEGRSTRGWVESLRYQSIAAGSTVLETSLDAHPGEAMATAFYLDGDRLLLTHYCVAKNQPRLEASAYADGGRTVVFTFKDGANIPTRDRGHMDRAVFTFDAPDRVRSRWTWYQDGKEKWFEEIVQTRRP